MGNMDGSRCGRGGVAVKGGYRDGGDANDDIIGQPSNILPCLLSHV